MFIDSRKLITLEVKPSGMTVHRLSHLCHTCGCIITVEHHGLETELASLNAISLMNKAIKAIGEHYLFHDLEALESRGCNQ